MSRLAHLDNNCAWQSTLAAAISGQTLQILSYVHNMQAHARPLAPTTAMLQVHTHMPIAHSASNMQMALMRRETTPQTR